jgi:hypothetical protein
MKTFQIDSKTRLVNVETARDLLFSIKGITLSKYTIQAYCRTGKWKKDVHWKKYAGHYQIYMDAVYEEVSK